MNLGAPTTTIRVTVATRDRVQALIREEFPGMTVDDAINHLCDEHWKAGALADMERFRQQDPTAYQSYLRKSRVMDDEAADDLEATA